MSLQQYFQSLICNNCLAMFSLLLLWIVALTRLFRSRGNLVLENLVFRATTRWSSPAIVLWQQSPDDTQNCGAPIGSLQLHIIVERPVQFT
jgi:hypothetical protein